MNSLQAQIIQNLIDMKVDEIYSGELLTTMEERRQVLLRKLVDAAPLFAEKHEIEVNFDE